MTAPMTILAAALDKVQHDPAACSLPARAQAERAAILVIAQTIEVEGSQHITLQVACFPT